MKTLAVISLLLLSAAWFIWPGICSAARARNRRSRIACLNGTGRSARTRRRRFPGAWAAAPLAVPSGLSQPECPRPVRYHDAPGHRPGTGRGRRRAALGRDEGVVRDHAVSRRPPATSSCRWRTWPRGRAADPGARAVDDRSPCAAAAGGKRRAGLAHLPGTCWPRSAKRGWASMRPCRGCSIR